MSVATAQAKFREGLRDLPRADKLLLGGFLALAVLALALGGLFALIVALDEAGLVNQAAGPAFQFLTLHGSTAFYYWLYFVQAGVILALILVYTAGARLTATWRTVAWLGLGLMLVGWVIDVVTPAQGTAVLYSASMPLAQQYEGAGYFYVGYILLAAGLALTALVGLVTAIKPKLAGNVGEWTSISYAAFLWEGLLMVAAVISLLAYVPAAQMAFGMRPIFRNFSYTMSWAVLFHNMHYLPLMSTVLVWYALTEAMTGVKSVFSDRFSKAIFSLYLVFVPPTSLYHLFLEPGVATSVKLLGSVLALFISVPTISVFLLIVASLQACANGQGARGLFGWLRHLPWRNPAFAAIGMAPVSAFAGGVVANVLIQEGLAPLLSDTFAVPGYFHFFTVGTVTLTFIGALLYMVPALTGHRLWLPSLAAVLPYGLTVGVYLFGLAGVMAGYAGVPRRAMEFEYGGAAPPAWGRLMMVAGIGGLIMVAVGVVYVAILAVTAFRDTPVGQKVEELPVASFNVADAIGQRAWFGPAAAGVLLAGMYLATTLAFQLMQSLPISGG